jgi:5-methylcytosine-specific restriction protein B
VLVLDEMNLAHVERYFSDALSGMESGAACLPNLARHDGLWYPKGDQPYIPFPSNLFVIGTVNVDETTYMFSPKVLDRANTIEFRVHTSELDADAQKPSSCEPGPEDLVRGFLEIARDQEFHRHTPHQAAASFQEALRRVHEILLETGWEFGHRVYYEAIRFAAMYQASGDPRWEDALDVQILQKILPRLHGSRRKLEPTLVALGRFCVELPLSSDAAHAVGATGFDPLSIPDTPVRLPRAFDKIRRMTRNLRANQFTGFAE